MIGVVRSALCLLVCVVACGGAPQDLPRHEVEPASSAASEGPLAEVSERFQAKAGPEASGFLMLDRDAEALRWRLALLDHAVHSVDMQYYLWHGDFAGKLLLEAALRAADRGAKVRLLVDDFAMGGRDRNLRAIQSHPNVQLRIINPWSERSSTVGRMVEFLGRMEQLNHRMHNKALIADGRFAIVGGRNIGNAYFGLSERSNFRDLDLLAVGPIASPVADAFAAYWNSSLVLELQPNESSPADLVSLRGRFAEQLAEDERSGSFPLERHDWSERLSDLLERMHVGSGEVVVDDIEEGGPVDISHRAALEVVSSAQTEVLVENAYFVPGEAGFEVIEDLQRRNVRIRILTNSLAAQDVPAVNSAYKKYRGRLLDHGVELYELRVDARFDDLQDAIPVRSARSSLHTKAYVVDGDTVYVGSHNFDPRSARLNTELGLLVISPGLAAAIEGRFDVDVLPENAWHVERTDDGKLTWQAGDHVVSRQPARGTWQRLQDAFLGLLPIEDQL